MMVSPVPVAACCGRPTDSLHICPHYRTCHAQPGMHIEHYVLEWLWQYQEQFVFVHQEGMPVAQVVQRSQCEVSYRPRCQFYFHWRMYSKLKSFAINLRPKFELLIYLLMSYPQLQGYSSFS